MADVAVDDPSRRHRAAGLGRRPRTFVKIQPHLAVSQDRLSLPRCAEQVLAKRVYDGFGPRRLLFGSDWPGVEKFCRYGQRACAGGREMKFLTASDRVAILGGNAARIFTT